MTNLGLKLTAADVKVGLAKWSKVPKRAAADPTPWKVWKLSKAGKRVGKNPVRQFAAEADALDFVVRESASGFSLELERAS